MKKRNNIFNKKSYFELFVDEYMDLTKSNKSKNKKNKKYKRYEKKSNNIVNYNKFNNNKIKFIHHLIKIILIILSLVILTFICFLIFHSILIKKENKNINVFSSSATIYNISNISKMNQVININQNSKKNSIKRIGVVSLNNGQNFGNFMVKYAMFKKLKELDFDPVIITETDPGCNIDFLEKTLKLKIIKYKFSELNESDYDFLMVNSDQIWHNWDQYFYDLAFLRFAENWKIPKFVYGASLGGSIWTHSKSVDEIGKHLLKNFTGISVREKGIMKLVEEHLNVKPEFVLDPTFFFTKNFYLDIIKEFNIDFNKKYIMVYLFEKNIKISNFIREASQKLNYEIHNFDLNDIKFIEKFIFRINNTEAVITDSYHGIIFSIIFNKPFISFINTIRGDSRFYTLKEIFDLGDRIISPDSTNLNINLLLTPLNINQTLLDSLKSLSLNFLEKNLKIIK